MLGRDKIIETEIALKNAGIVDSLEAEWLVTLAIGKNKISEVINYSLSHDDEVKVNDAINKRIQGMPLSYIIGNTEFFGRVFNVNENVLIPRPETEILVEKVMLDINKESKQLNVLDLCTGSGIIGITLSLETNAMVVAADISSEAIDVASKNNDKLGANVEFIKSDLFQNISQKFDIIVSNPPYIKSEDILYLQSEVKNHEPHLALDGGDSGLEFYKKIIKDAPKHLNPNGKLYFEIGMGQAEDIICLMKKDFTNIQVLKDYNKIDRVIIGNLRGD